MGRKNRLNLSEVTSLCRQLEETRSSSHWRLLSVFISHVTTLEQACVNKTAGANKLSSVWDEIENIFEVEIRAVFFIS